MTLDLLFLAGLAACSLGLGLWLLGRARCLPDSRLDALALAAPLGLGTLALALLGLGEVGLLKTPGVVAVAVLCAAVGLPRLAREIRRPRVPLRLAWPDAVLAGFTAVALVASLLASLVPVTDGDALCYHLLVPRRFLERGAVGFDPDLHETVYPLLTELLYAAALALRGPVACRLVQWWLGVVFALNATALARPFLGRRAGWAGAIAVLVPAVSNGMAAPLNDVALAAFGTAALVAWSRFDETPGLRRAAFGGVMLGLALGVKYPALVLAGLVGLAVGPWRLPGVFRSATPQGSPRFRACAAESAAFGLAVLLVGGVWYARAYAHTGNPVFPFFRQVFGGAGLDEVLDPRKKVMAPTAWNVLTALGPMTLRPARFDSLAHQFGPVFLLFLPALLWEKPPRRLLGLTALGYAFLTVCVTQRQSMRFVLTALGPLSVGVAWLASTWRDRPSVPAKALLALLLLALGAESVVAAGRVRHGWRVVAGSESAEQYLERSEPTFRVGRWVDAHLPPDARVVGQDHRGFYIPRDYTMELAHRRRTGLGRRGETPETLVAGLRQSGFTHVLLCPPVPADAVEFDPTLSDRLAPWLAARTPLYREDLADADGVVRRYAVYALDAAEKQGSMASGPPAGPRR